MPRLKVDNVEPDEAARSEELGASNSEVVGSAVEKTSLRRDPRFPNEPTTDEELRRVSGSPMAAFAAFPAQVHFSGEHKDEDIILLLRAHPVTNVPWILIVIGMGLLPLIVLPLLSAIGGLAGLSAGTIFVTTVFWYMGTFTYGLLNALYWYFNVGIVTGERIVDIDWSNVIYRDVASALMSKVQDVRADQAGVFAGVFDFGSVYVQTAGTEPNIEFLRVPHPQLVVRKIQELMAAEEKEWETKP
ncbi:MAG: hypothetical protein UY21_C0022G0002 [Microgenomates group bacterium GW2011_GWA1_48_10]|uniref:DUF304 domain-containing protein n=1 Tax=Candidatus Gottesmanbacteria bacterium RIFCSPHIGHO2_01_FULL_47_48 TaxID=1798381 RepID=A0A1F6A269_9BACT|nr:MAG: hypothetical protein UY21_C0022G0002 [Microgenomates group bacterium GW2011_GWA1_48_10]OGG18437.1 MAG: hypothetical protein A2721_01465 [Candidatus Gottesmanbacteria bacterium RIFCSPHIGHO2_01_FULL_47_48]